MRGESMKGKSKKSTYSTTFGVDPKTRRSAARILKEDVYKRQVLKDNYALFYIIVDCGGVGLEDVYKRQG